MEASSALIETPAIERISQRKHSEAEVLKKALRHATVGNRLREPSAKPELGIALGNM